MRIRCLLLWLSIATVVRAAAEPKCPEISTMFVEEDCEEKMYCERPKPSTDGKSFSCAADTTFEGRESKKSAWEPLKEVKCALSKDVHFIVAKMKGDAKKFDDYTQFRCIAPVCSVDSSVGLKTTFCVKGENCVKAIVGKSMLSCPDKNILELKKADGRRIDLTSNRCIGSKISSDIYNGAIDDYGCRPEKGCTDYASYYPNTCGLKEKCAEPTVISRLPCTLPLKLQVSYTEDLSWELSKTPECKNNHWIVPSASDIPLAFRCVGNAKCEIDFASLFDAVDCGQKECDAVTLRETTGVTCEDYTDANFLMEFQEKGGTPWKLVTDIGCYNNYLVDHGSNTKIDGKIRCRLTKGNDMTKYYIETECDQKKVCSMPSKVAASETKYECKDEKFELEFQGKLTKAGNWIDIESAEFKDPVFVMKNKPETEDNKHIPIQFRCIRDAICEINPETKFNSDTCPVRDKDNCESPKLAHALKNIVCTDGKVVEYQTNEGEAWKELSELGCYNGVLEPKRDNGPVAAADVVNLRCRTPRKCEIDKYYDADIPECKTKFVCEKPAVETANPKLYKCNTDYDILYKVLGYTSEVAEEWKKIDQLKCEKDRFVLVENKANAPVDLPDIPVALSCALDKKCDLQYFTSDDDCDAATEVCAKPIAGPSTPDTPYNLTCADPIMALRVKDDLDGAWVMVKYVTCNGEGFTVYREDNEKFDKFALRIQCVRLTTTTCVNPCKGRPECESEVELFESTAWDQPAKLHCVVKDGKGKIFTIGNQDEGMLFKDPLTCTGKDDEKGMDVWMNEQGDGNGKCLDASCMKDKPIACIDKIFCKDLWPLRSHCSRQTNDCNMVSINNYDEITCKDESQMILQLPVSGKKINGTRLRCNLLKGEWNYTLMDGSVMNGLQQEAGAQEAPNVYCQYKSCDPNWLEKLFPVQNQTFCLENYDWCSRPTLMANSKRIYQCPENHATYFWDYAWQEWNQEPENTGQFMCCQSEVAQLLDFGGDVREDQYTCFGMAEPLERQRPAVKCVRRPTCFEKNPLRSDCEGKENCATYAFNDSDEQYTCNVQAKYYWHVNGVKHEDEFMDTISCDNIYSEWSGGGDSSVEAKFETGSNVVCMKTAGSTMIPLTGLALILLAAIQ